MGKVRRLAKRPVYHINHEMLYGSHYYRKKTVVRLLNSYYKLRELAKLKSNYVALDIWVDLNMALFYPKVLTDRQRQCIIGVYVLGYRQWEVGNAIGIAQETVYDALSRGVRNIQKTLITGKLYHKKAKTLFFTPRSGL
jgi:DNA-directed RNA polymerase specialized sigma subunit